MPEPVTAIQPLAVGLDKAARMIGIAPRTLRRRAAKGQVASCKIGGRLLFTLDDLHALLDAHRRPASRPIRIK